MDEEELSGRKGSIGEEAGTRPMGTTPREGVPAARAEAAAPEDHAEDLPREGETELSPGIPVEPAAPGRPEEGLLQDEIESVVQIFDGADEGPVRDPETASEALHDSPEEPASPEDDLAAGEIPDPAGEPEPPAELYGEHAGSEPSTEEAPAWVYEPSGAEEESLRRSRWIGWAGIAAAVVIAGAALAFFLGGGDEGAVEPAPQAGGAAVASGPPPVEIPQAPGEPAGGAGSPGGGQGEPPAAPKEPTAAPERKPATPTAAPATRSPAPAVATAGTGSGPLASGDPGNILQSGPFRDARGLLGSGRYREASRGFQAGLAGRSGLYTVQLALACRAETVKRAVDSTRGAQQFFILPKEFNGRACYRLLWGTFSSRDAAERGRSTVPGAFLRDPSPPFVAPL